MRHNPAPKKSMLQRFLRPIDELIDQDNLARLIFRLQRTHRAHADYPSHPQALQRPNICPMIQFTRQDPMPPPMPGQKSDFPSAHFTCQNFIRRFTERRIHLHPLLLREPFDLVQTTSANNSNPAHLDESAPSLIARSRASPARSAIQSEIPTNLPGSAYILALSVRAPAS